MLYSFANRKLAKRQLAAAHANTNEATSLICTDFSIGKFSSLVSQNTVSNGQIRSSSEFRRIYGHKSRSIQLLDGNDNQNQNQNQFTYAQTNCNLRKFITNENEYRKSANRQSAANEYKCRWRVHFNCFYRLLFIVFCFVSLLFAVMCFCGVLCSILCLVVFFSRWQWRRSRMCDLYMCMNASICVCMVYLCDDCLDLHKVVKWTRQDTRNSTTTAGFL